MCVPDGPGGARGPSQGALAGARGAAGREERGGTGPERSLGRCLKISITTILISANNAT